MLVVQLLYWTNVFSNFKLVYLYMYTRYFSVKCYGPYWKIYLDKYCVLRGGIQRRALPLYQSEKMKMLSISLCLVRIEPTIVAVTVARFGPCTSRAPIIFFYYFFTNTDYISIDRNQETIQNV